MTTTALSCGNLNSAARPERDGVQWVSLPSTPGRADVDPLLAELDGRLVVQGTDADLAAVVVRLLRRNRLDIAIGFVPTTTSSVAALWGLGEFALAFDGTPRPVPLIRDDSGGVLLGSARIEPIFGQVYCDDQRVLNGAALAMEVTPDPAAAALPTPTADPLATDVEPAEDGLRITVTRRGLLCRRRAEARGRAIQASFRPATVHRDGVPHPRPVDKWGWYRHTQDLLLIR